MSRKRPNMTVRARTLNADARSVEVVLSTANPVEVARGKNSVLEALDPEGAVYTEPLPLVDSHEVGSVGDFLGSVAGIRVEGNELVGVATFATTPEGERAWTLVQEGHLAYLSIGYVPEQEELVDGVIVVKRWRLLEASMLAIPADYGAQVRAAHQENIMEEKDKAEKSAEETREDAAAELVAVEPDPAIAELAAMVQELKAEVAAMRADTKPEDEAAAEATAETETETDPAEGDEETQRCAAIVQLCAAAGRSGEAAGYITQKSSIKEVRAALMADQENKTNKNAGVGASITRDARDTFARGAADAILVRAGAIKADKACGESAQFRGYRMIDLVAAALEQDGISVRAHDSRAVMERYKAARRSGQTTSDFPSIYLNALNKILAADFVEQNSAWRTLAKVISGNDLRDHKLIKSGAFADLGKVGESGEVPYASFGADKAETLTPSIWAVKTSISDTMILNDDLNVFSAARTKFAAAANRTVAKAFWAKLLANPTMGEDNKALFHADHGNLITGANKPPAVAQLDAGFAALGKQVDTSGNPLNIAPRYLVVPKALEGAAWTVVNSQYVPGGTNNTTNRYNGLLTVVGDAFLDLGVSLDGETFAGSANAWYLMADPSVFPSIVVGFVDGESPVVEDDRPLGVMGTEFRVSLKFGVGVEDFRGVLRVNNA